MRSTALAAALALSLAACGGGPAARVPAGQCFDPPAGQVALLETSLEVTGGTLPVVKAVRSPRPHEGKDVYFISGEVDGEGLEGPGEIATWATQSIGSFEADFVAVSGLATQVSKLPSPPELPYTDPSYPGVRESQECVRPAQGRRAPAADPAG